jgi:glycosidase
MKKLLSILFLFLFAFHTNAQNTEKKVVLQAFWWDYTNSNYTNSWANYLTELAPRLKTMGIDAIWIPPSYKNSGTNSVGYSPFDHYDLGDKYQKGATTTRFGTKDEFLRMVAVMHANGIEVIQDVVLNHVDGAGATNSAGGQDPEPTYSMATNSGFKNFRYICYATPEGNTSATADDYLSRTGRWSKNYQNFHPHAGHNAYNDDWTQPFWGPDFCYGYQQDGTGNGYGQSTNATCGLCHNPNQASNYNRDEARNWLTWFVKQTDIDGFRWDAVKHFPHFVVQDLSYNVKYLNGWASRGENMLNFGEFVGGGSDLDNWVNNVAFSNGGSEKLIGAMDFGLRGAFYGIIAGNGGYDLSQVPGAQHQERVTYYSSTNTYVHRTIPFVNTHDTYRPILDSDGNITGWNTANELAAHIDPNDPRLAAAYALNFALDGNPLIFFEDVFNINNTSKRFTHEPTNTTDLPANSSIANLIWCHQNLDFKAGPYKVRGHSGNANDHLIIERGGKAIISVTDSWTNWQTDWVDSDFAPGTVLKDYGNSNSGTTTVQNDKRVQISTPPCNGSATRRGYAIWAPVGQDNDTYTPDRSALTTQEWEMADDLGDSHCESLQQGGQLPDNSTAYRTVGKIYVQQGKTVNFEIYGQTSNSITLTLLDIEGNSFYERSGAAPLIETHTPQFSGWITIKIRNTSNSYAGQKCWVKAKYTGPTVVDTKANPSILENAVWTGEIDSDFLNCSNWLEGKKPSASKGAIIPVNTPNVPIVNSNILIKSIEIENGATLTIDGNSRITLRGGDYINNGTVHLTGCGEVRFVEGFTAVPSRIVGNGDFCKLIIDNQNGVLLETDVNISSILEFKDGHLILDNHHLVIGENASIQNANATTYIISKNSPTAQGLVSQHIDNNEKLYPIGTATAYTPVTVSHQGSKQPYKIRVFEDVYASGFQGNLLNGQDSIVKLTWQLEETIGVEKLKAKVQWSGYEGNGFNPANASIASFTNDSWKRVNSTIVSSGSPRMVESVEGELDNSAYIAIMDTLHSLIATPNNGGNPGNENPVVFTASPNPSKGSTQLLAEGNYKNEEIVLTIYSMDGKLVRQTKGSLSDVNEDLQANFKDLYRGVYIFSIEYQNEWTRLRVLKN